MFRLTIAPLSLALRRSVLPTSRIALRRTFITTPLIRGTFKEQPIVTDPSTPPKNPTEPPEDHGEERKQVTKKVFKPEELEAARLARLANLGWLAKLPEKWIPYAELMRLEKPVGTLLLLAPCFWAITMGAYSIAAPLALTLKTIALFTIGALVMRGAGCTINDIWDRDLDNQVARTVERPIASGRVSVPQAVAWMGVQCFAGLAVLLSLPFDCFYLGALSLPFVAAYPLFKRYTYYPQAVLSITFAWGCLLGFPAVGAPLNLWVAGPLFASKWFWCMIYDTVYAHQDKVYDVNAGIKSTALAWGDKSKPIMYLMGALQVATFLTAGFMNSMGPFFYLSAAWGFLRLFRQLKEVNLDDPKSCWATFTGNIVTGYIFWAGMVVDYLLVLLGIL
ncbi:4-hydroxybenzoate polyprenyl transferase [Candidozyma pseudohaemuli]|uniref:4-hydroxybenzoate polyprenyltransferase, mitochondrial n=1 Tax=Candidozyma pseudohaemuli TaxID=418784 RepID=A0A2P7YNQ3_9ASCO|nr:4-hydroxybenzoate polyprenyl transferase [[Candida] pseudohaemulonii]PSK37570.1 4-hydroxybenzoate polyprenyl transferase [[Candida] pseudohaemulonii]